MYHGQETLRNRGWLFSYLKKVDYFVIFGGVLEGRELELGVKLRGDGF